MKNITRHTSLAPIPLSIAGPLKRREKLSYQRQLRLKFWLERLWDGLVLGAPDIFRDFFPMVELTPLKSVVSVRPGPNETQGRHHGNQQIMSKYEMCAMSTQSSVAVADIAVGVGPKRLLAHVVPL